MGFGVPATIAVGSSLCQQCGTSLASFVKYRQLQRGEPTIDLLMLGGSLMGVDAGTRLLSHLSRLPPVTLFGTPPIPFVRVVLDLSFFLLLAATALLIFREAWGARLNASTAVTTETARPGPLVTRVRIPPYIDLTHVGLKQVSIPMLAYLGFLLGLASGVLGIGSGVIFLPILMYGIGLSAKDAAGTGVLLLFVTVSLGTGEQAWQGNVSLPLAMAILLGSSIGSQLGAATTNRLPDHTLRLVFAALVTLTALIVGANFVGLILQR